MPNHSWAEQNPEDWMRALAGATRELLQESSIRAESVVEPPTAFTTVGGATASELWLQIVCDCLVRGLGEGAIKG